MPTRATARFADRHATHAAVEQLVQAGFPRDAISLVMSEDTHEREFGSREGENSASDTSGVRTLRQSGVLATIVSGMVVLASPSGVVMRAAGPFVTELLQGSGSGRAFAGSAATESVGLADHETRFVDEVVRAGSIVVGVHAPDDRARLAVELLELSGGSTLAAA